MRSYELKLDHYEGPLAKLLELIEARKLEVSAVSLGKVTDDFLHYLESLTDADYRQMNAELSVGAGQREFRADLRVVADFIVIASRLVFLKSKSLIPELSLTEEEEADLKDLELRVKLYRELRPAMKHIVSLWGSRHALRARPYFLTAGFFGGGSEAGLPATRLRSRRWQAGPRVFYPGKSTDAAALARALAGILESAERLMREEQVIREKITTLEEKMADVVRHMAAIAETSFHTLSETASRSELIVTFLAVLHLAREQAVFIEQERHLSDIIIKRK